MASLFGASGLRGNFDNIPCIERRVRITAEALSHNTFRIQLGSVLSSSFPLSKNRRSYFCLFILLCMCHSSITFRHSFITFCHPSISFCHPSITFHHSFITFRHSSITFCLFSLSFCRPFFSFPPPFLYPTIFTFRKHSLLSGPHPSFYTHNVSEAISRGEYGTYRSKFHQRRGPVTGPQTREYIDRRRPLSCICQS
jgi:hypothetical protein